jgi:hypothetical protein
VKALLGSRQAPRNDRFNSLNGAVEQKRNLLPLLFIEPVQNVSCSVHLARRSANAHPNAKKVEARERAVNRLDSVVPTVTATKL